MKRIQRVSDVIELISEKALVWGLGGILSLCLSALFYYYRGQSGGTVPLATVLLLIGLGALGYAIKHALTIREVTKYDVKCPYCNETNQVLEAPEDDFTCMFCHRFIPIQDQQPMPVAQVRCGFCNSLNFYSAKTDVLLCEECNREVPIATSDETRPKKQLAAAYVTHIDDEHMYELLLTDKGHKQEDLIAALQHMLALNRNQVKQMLDELPVTLLTGINRRKAEMLQAQLSLHDAGTEMRQISDNANR